MKKRLMAYFVLWKKQIKVFQSKLKEEDNKLCYKNAFFWKRFSFLFLWWIYAMIVMKMFKTNLPMEVGI